MRAEQQSKRSAEKGVFLFFLLFHLAPLFVPEAWGVEYTVKQIADDQFNNREPVITDQGLAAWSAYALGPEGVQGDSEIHIYRNGERRSLTAGNVPIGTTHYRPCAHETSLVWVGSFPYPMGDANWVLKEVPTPERDTPYPELIATGRHITPSEKEPEQPPEGESPSEEELAKREEAPDAIRRHPSGHMEIAAWFGDDVQRITRDARNDFGPSLWGRTIAWQKSKGFPFGWEIMVWADGTMYQLTTNFFYDMAPQVQGDQVVWYGWDGNDYEIFLHDRKAEITFQVTSNLYDDVSPVLWNGVIAWEAYPGVDAEVYLWKENRFQRLSDNPWDDLNPHIWDGKVVWQGFDGDDFEIYLFDGQKTIKLTSNRFDDVNPDIRDNIICWMSYFDNWDSEIFAWDIVANQPVILIGEGGQPGVTAGRLSYNDFEDRDPRTAGGRIIWQGTDNSRSLIYLAEPRR